MVEGEQMDISGQGWELLVTRLGVQKSGAHERTYGSYQAYLDGEALTGLAGFLCECIGPGENKHAGNHKRIEQGRYPLWTQEGKYQSVDYSSNNVEQGKQPMPGLRLADTGKRTGILIHPAHLPTLYLSSIGCLNPTEALRADQMMDFWDSRARVIALIESLRGFQSAPFAHPAVRPIPSCSILIVGEP
jgi:hypothetical protein